VSEAGRVFDPMLLRLAALNAAYAAAIDADRLEQWPDFFAPDCLYKITSADNHKRGYAAGIVYADSQDMLRDRITALRSANIFERHSYRHIVGLPVVGDESPDGIRAETAFVVVRTMRTGAMDIFAAGVCLDRVIEIDGKLLFAERVVVCDSSHFDTLLVIPL
jgi:3-phenylpropionate/cinnamic acid dioxygenase small subunit